MMDTELLALAPLWYVAFLLSLTCHEAAHAWVAKLGGDSTAANQITLNPLPHMQREIFGTVVVPVLSLFLAGWMIGWASAPFDPYWQQRHPHRAAWMALAGPAANLALAILAGVAIHIGILGGWLAYPAAVGFTRVVDPGVGQYAGAAAQFLSILFAQNVLLMAFNLMPVPPLDGSTAIGLLMSEDQALRVYAFMRDPTFSFAGLVLAWYFFGRLFYPVFGFALRALYPGYFL